VAPEVISLPAEGSLRRGEFSDVQQGKWPESVDYFARSGESTITVAEYGGNSRKNSAAAPLKAVCATSGEPVPVRAASSCGMP
jgi:hypothetical protein